MRTKIPLALILCVLLSSCIKDYLGGGKNGIELTETNYVYEGGLYQLYLTAAIDDITIVINDLEDIIKNNQGDAQTQADLDEAIEERENLSGELQDIIDIVARGIVPPPPPCPDGDLCLPIDFRYLIATRNNLVLSFEILDEQGNSLVSDTSPPTRRLRGSRNLLNYQEYDIADYTGFVEIKVVKRDNQQNITSYSIEAFKE
ncbi:hypothetical protein [Muriicola sp. Z0-33]|uniref:hypothetical protein n=1 Tax=Muriicola sp. Z0-33 TaxID=2816957 RepID=UPI002237BA42|nr:hypothetical protein [Muriicola sp. Z0-33]MCW5516893.1 hypothetical protein [Muriicola sp. Z0-33]